MQPAPPAPPPRANRNLTAVLAGLGGLIVGLVIVLIVILLTSGDDDGIAATTSPTSTTAVSTTTTSQPASTTTPGSTTQAPATTTTSPTTTSSTTTTTTTPPFGGDTNEKSSEGIIGTPGALTDIRLGEHPGYTRVVFDFEGSGEHWWIVKYTPQILGGGSGEPCDVDGTALLSVEAQPASAFWVEQTYFGPTEFSPSFESSVVEVKYCEDFEAALQVGIGVDDEKPFEAFVLQDPLRLVIDIAD